MRRNRLGLWWEAGKEITSADLNKIVEVLLSLFYIPGPGQRKWETADGWTLVPKTERSEPETPPRFKLRIAGAGKVTVGRGLVYGGGADITPKIGATLITATPAPQLAITGNGFVYLEMTFTGDVVTAAEIKFAAAIPANTDTLAYQQVGEISNWDAEQQTFSPHQDVLWNVSIARCGASYTKDAAP